MKKYLVNIVLFATALLGIVACSNESEMNETPAPLAGESSISFTIDGIQPTTRATQVGTETPTPALDREKSVSELYVALFANGNLYKVLPATPKTAPTYEVKGIAAGTYDCYLVANPAADLVTKLNALTTVSTVDNFDALVATQTPGENNTATHFLMTSAKKTVNVVANQTTDAGTIDLVRVAARFDVYNTIAKLNMTKITFKNRYTQSSLNRGAANMTMDPALVKNSTKTYGVAEGLSEKQCIAAIYGYENMTKNETVLTLEATYNGIQVKPFDIKIKDIPVKRNHLYSIVLSPKGSTIDPNDVFGSMNVNIVVVDWNVGTTLSIVGDELVNKATPNITVSGAGVTSSPLTNPTTVSLISGSTTSVTVRVETEGAAAVLSPMTGTGYTVTGGDATVENGKLVQTFTIAVEPNTTGSVRNFDFTVANALDASKKRSFTIQHSNRPKVAIEYLAEYPVNVAGDGFATSHDPNQSGYFSFYKATGKESISYNNNGENILDAPAFAGYHLPDREEWQAIVPRYLYLDLLRDEVQRNVHVRIGGKIYYNCTDSISSKGDGKAYALRFQGTSSEHPMEIRTAVRYEYVNSNYATDGINNHVKITSRYLGEAWDGTLADVKTEEFWDTNNSDDAVVYIPLLGWKKDGNSYVEEYNQIGWYWSSKDTSHTTPGGDFYDAAVASYWSYKSCKVDNNSKWRENRFPLLLIANN